MKTRLAGWMGARRAEEPRLVARMGALLAEEGRVSPKE
jgi:hypothetical protein